jgi:predicted HTH transcriptional regulator
VAFKDDSIWIESPGGPVLGMTVEKRKRGESSSWNPVIARIFKELDLIEEWGTGIPQVIESLAEAGLPEPEFHESRERIRITVHTQNHDPLKFRLDSDGRRRVPGEHQVAGSEHQVKHQVVGGEHQVGEAEHQVDRVEHQVGETQHKVEPSLGPRSAALLKHLKAGPARRSDIFAVMGVHNDHRAYSRHLVPLIEQQLVAMTNPCNPTASTQRYVITDQGREWLALPEKESAV